MADTSVFTNELAVSITGVLIGGLSTVLLGVIALGIKFLHAKIEEFADNQTKLLVAFGKTEERIETLFHVINRHENVIYQMRRSESAV